MAVPEFMNTAIALVGGDKGLLAMEEVTPTCDRRCAALGNRRTEEIRWGPIAN